MREPWPSGRVSGRAPTKQWGYPPPQSPWPLSCFACLGLQLWIHFARIPLSAFSGEKNVSLLFFFLVVVVVFLFFGVFL